jgi:hypothetical protein
LDLAFRGSHQIENLPGRIPSRALFSLAGFQVTLIGRFWVTAEVAVTETRSHLTNAEGSVLIVC